jgi:hypothetical protein
MKFTLYWLSAERQVIEGDTIEDAFTKAGYGNGATKALDFYAVGEDDSYYWDNSISQWVKKLPE